MRRREKAKLYRESQRLRRHLNLYRAWRLGLPTWMAAEAAHCSRSLVQKKYKEFRTILSQLVD